MLYQSYVVWNNKGGTGKTTITFHLSTEYAIQNPNKKIIVIDMCPQGNISAAFLSGLDKDMNGIAGDEVLQNINGGEKVAEIFNKSVCGYLESKLERGLRNAIRCDSFLVQPSMHNRYITDNIYLLCGDPYLEVIAKRLQQDRELIETRPHDVPWKRVTLFIKDFIEEISRRTENEYIFFIDTNPSFSIYTEMAIVGATRIIVPINADDFCKSAVTSMLYLLYGIVIDGIPDERYNVLTKVMFSKLAEKNEIEIPKIHLIINNKITSYDNAAAKAFEAKAIEISGLINGIRQANPDIFEEEANNEYDCKLNDFHTKAVQCLQLGCPLSKLPSLVKMTGNEYVKNLGPDGDNYLQSLQLIINRL